MDWIVTVIFYDQEGTDQTEIRELYNLDFVEVLDFIEEKYYNYPIIEISIKNNDK